MKIVAFQNYFKQWLASECANDLKPAVFYIKLVSSGKCLSSFLYFKVLVFSPITDLSLSHVFDALLSSEIVTGDPQAESEKLDGVPFVHRDHLIDYCTSRFTKDVINKRMITFKENG